MNRNLAIKLCAIGVLILLLLIPLLQIQGVIHERQAARDGVIQDIARSSSYTQKITGPILVVPFHRTVREWKVNPNNSQRYLDEHEVVGRLYFLPETFLLNGKMQTEVRSRGIYNARLYHATNEISGQFEVPANFGVSGDVADYRFEPAFIALGISDIRGIEKALKLRMNGETLDFQPGSQLKFIGDGAHVTLPALNPQHALKLDFGFDLALQGTGQLDIVPVGRDSKVALAADWPHPSFMGDFLPAEREVDAAGFRAHWQTSFFSTNMEEAVKDCAYRSNCAEFNSRNFGVSLIDPVDQYLKSERAIKYAMLFLGLTFAGFFLFEVLKSLSVHPVQYGLVGLALAFFYLLLLSLSEHIGFAKAYLISSIACVLLIGFYVSNVLQSVWRGLGFTAALAALYGLLYGLLSSEDYALLMGSLLLFGLLGVVMIVTRKLDWYSVGKLGPKLQPT